MISQCEIYISVCKLRQKKKKKTKDKPKQSNGILSQLIAYILQCL